MNRWSWPGAVALVLATCVGVAYAIAVVLVVLEPGRLEGPGAVLLYISTGALISGLVGWLSRKDDDRGE